MSNLFFETRPQTFSDFHVESDVLQSHIKENVHMNLENAKEKMWTKHAYGRDEKLSKEKDVV